MIQTIYAVKKPGSVRFQGAGRHKNNPSGTPGHAPRKFPPVGAISCFIACSAPRQGRVPK